MYITGIIHSLHTYARHISTYVHDLPLVPLVPLVPLIPLVYLLGTLLAVSGSVHLFSLLLVNWPPFVLPVAHVLPLSKIPTPRGFPDLNIHSIRMTLWTKSRRSRTPIPIPIHCKKSLAKFRCGQRWREPNNVGVGKFLLPRRLVLRHRCQHRSLAHSDMAFLQCTYTYIYTYSYTYT
jgi:hypothetical protein